MQCAQSDDRSRHAGLRPDPLNANRERATHNRRSIRAPTRLWRDLSPARGNRPAEGHPSDGAGAS